MAVLISLLKGVNIGGHHKIKMDALRELYATMGLPDARTYVQSGNILFRAAERDRARIAKRIGDGIEEKYGFRPEVVLRTLPEMKSVVTRNPFAGREVLEPHKLAVLFLAGAPQGAKSLVVKADKEEVKIDGQEVFVYFPDGIGKSKLSVPAIEKGLKTIATARNWNTVLKLVELGEELA